MAGADLGAHIQPESFNAVIGTAEWVEARANSERIGSERSQCQEPFNTWSPKHH